MITWWRVVKITVIARLKLSATTKMMCLVPPKLWSAEVCWLAHSLQIQIDAMESIGGIWLFQNNPLPLAGGGLKDGALALQF